MLGLFFAAPAFGEYSGLTEDRLYRFLTDRQTGYSGSEDFFAALATDSALRARVDELVRGSPRLQKMVAEGQEFRAKTVADLSARFGKSTTTQAFGVFPGKKVRESFDSFRKLHVHAMDEAPLSEIRRKQIAADKVNRTKRLLPPLQPGDMEAANGKFITAEYEGKIVEISGQDVYDAYTTEMYRLLEATDMVARDRQNEQEAFEFWRHQTLKDVEGAIVEAGRESLRLYTQMSGRLSYPRLLTGNPRSVNVRSQNRRLLPHLRIAPDEIDSLKLAPGDPSKVDAKVAKGSFFPYETIPYFTLKSVLALFVAATDLYRDYKYYGRSGVLSADSNKDIWEKKSVSIEIPGYGQVEFPEDLYDQPIFVHPDFDYEKAEAIKQSWLILTALRKQLREAKTPAEFEKALKTAEKAEFDLKQRGGLVAQLNWEPTGKGASIDSAIGLRWWGARMARFHWLGRDKAKGPNFLAEIQKDSPRKPGLLSRLANTYLRTPSIVTRAANVAVMVAGVYFGVQAFKEWKKPADAKPTSFAAAQRVQDDAPLPVFKENDSGSANPSDVQEQLKRPLFKVNRAYNLGEPGGNFISLLAKKDFAATVEVPDAVALAKEPSGNETLVYETFSAQRFDGDKLPLPTRFNEDLSLLKVVDGEGKPVTFKLKRHPVYGSYLLEFTGSVPARVRISAGFVPSGKGKYVGPEAGWIRLAPGKAEEAQTRLRELKLDKTASELNQMALRNGRGSMNLYDLASAVMSNTGEYSLQPHAPPAAAEPGNEITRFKPVLRENKWCSKCDYSNDMLVEVANFLNDPASGVHFERASGYMIKGFASSSEPIIVTAGDLHAETFQIGRDHQGRQALLHVIDGTPSSFVAGEQNVFDQKMKPEEFLDKNRHESEYGVLPWFKRRVDDAESLGKTAWARAGRVNPNYYYGAAALLAALPAFYALRNLKRKKMPGEKIEPVTHADLKADIEELSRGLDRLVKTYPSLARLDKNDPKSYPHFRAKRLLTAMQRWSEAFDTGGEAHFVAALQELYPGLDFSGSADEIVQRMLDVEQKKLADVKKQSENPNAPERVRAFGNLAVSGLVTRSQETILDRGKCTQVLGKLRGKLF